MKSLVILALVVFPKFFKADHVDFVVPKFYSKVCSGQGIVEDYMISQGKISYVVRSTDSSMQCPTFFYDVPETDIKIHTGVE